jgi:hypothetical protein
MSVNFTIPKGYSAPEGVKEGEEFSDIVTFKFEGDKMMILNIGEDKAPIESREEKKEKPKGAKSAIKEQLSSLEDKKGSAKMEDSGSEDMDD